MGFFDKFTEIMREGDDDEFDDFYDEKSSYSMPSPPKREKSHRSVRVPKEEKPERIHRTRAESDKVVNIHTTAQLQVVLVKPERFEEAAAIGDNLNEKRTVVLNLESTNRDIARRLLDFLSGVAYANNGQIKRVANSTYIITPYNVDVMGDLIDELENSGMIMY
ncbi:MAG: cell division protein SepF [Clostridiales bacterium]|nr:cell division protein SepF [Clostridiales bacterium]